MDPATPQMMLAKITSVEYMKKTLLKYLLESMLVTFAFYWVVHKKMYLAQRKAPSIENVLKLFVYVIILFTVMDVLCPQVIPMVRTGIALAIGTHLGGGILMVKE
tara:strand:+ start:626 stop:940 length:315 start_codon:yes stop_codon:yes gene_type:complete